MKLIIEEKPSYFTLLTRKTFYHKTVETVIFILLLVGLSLYSGYASTMFKVGAFSGAFLVLLLSPVIYRAVVQPVYSLTETELTIKKQGNVRNIPLRKIEDSYDLSYILRIEGKKEVLGVSPKFIELLNEQRLRLKMKK